MSRAHCEPDAYLVRSICKIISEADPVGIAFAAPDEYELEARTIARRLTPSMSTQVIQAIVFEEFRSWFDEDAGTPDMYGGIADEIADIFSGSTDRYQHVSQCETQMPQTSGRPPHPYKPDDADRDFR